METIFACFKTLFLSQILVSPCECLVIKDLQKWRISFDSHKYAPPLFCIFAGWRHAVRLFYSHCLWLNDSDLSLFPGNGEFSVFIFRRIKSADSPPNSPFAMCRGHENFQNHNRMQRSDLEKSPPFSVRILR